MEPTGSAATASVESGMSDAAASRDLHAVADALRSERPRILEGWLATARAQPFHAAQPAATVSDDIPRLFDALVDLIGRASSVGEAVAPPRQDDLVETAARSHAAARAEQGLRPPDIAIEFRILRQEISHGLARQISDTLPASDVVVGIAVISDGIDAAITVALDALSRRIETLREEFLATTLHDMRQPVAVIASALHVLARHLRTADGAHVDDPEIIADAIAAAAEVSHSVDTLADASQVAMGAVTTDLELVDLAQLVDEAIEAIERSDRPRLEVRPVVGQRPLMVDCDSRLLRRALLNLITNALKYSSPGTVTIRSGGDGVMRWVEVIDQGIGLTSDELGRAFERYGRSPRARQMGVSGLGLGLYAARGIARALGGDVQLASDGPDRGARAVLTLPAAG